MAQAASSRFLHVTWIDLEGAFHVVARCDLCGVVAERRVEGEGEVAVLHVAGVEALAAHGCNHIDEVLSSGVRRAFSR